MTTRPLPAPPLAAAPASAPAPLTAAGLAVLLIAVMPVNFVFGSVNVLADAIGHDLGTGPAGQQLVLASYTTAFAAGLVVSGRIGDRCGRRRMLRIGGLAMAVISIATAFAPGLASVVVLRVLLGIGAGLLTPQVLATIQTTARGAARSRGLMLFAAVSGVSTVLGQIVAGIVATALPEDLGWRAVQVLTGLLALIGVLALRAVPATRSPHPLELDAPGSTVLGAALLLLVVPLTIGPSSGWPAWSLGALVAGVLLLAAFWALQLRSERAGRIPVVPPSVLRIVVVRRGLVMALLFFTTYGAMLYELAALAQSRYAMGPMGPAVLVLGFGIAFIATSALLPRVVPGAGERTMLRAGLVQSLILLAIAGLAATGHDDLATLQWALIPMGVAQACMFGPVLTTVLSRAPQEAAGTVGGLFATVQQLGLSLGVALLGGLFWSLAGHDAAGGAAGAAAGRSAADAAASMDLALGVVFAVHALCALVFAALARSLVALPADTAPVVDTALAADGASVADTAPTADAAPVVSAAPVAGAARVVSAAPTAPASGRPAG